MIQIEMHFLIVFYCLTINEKELVELLRVISYVTSVLLFVVVVVVAASYCCLMAVRFLPR
jgi:hypothetical protein